MRRIGGILLLVVLAACGGETAVEETGPAPEPTTSTSTTTTSTSTSTTTTLATTTTTPARATTTVVARTAPTARLVPTTAASDGCHPSYAGACLPVGPDVDCGDIGARRFTVVGPDVYRLDAD